MRIVMIADEPWLRRERSFLRHLVVGLADEQVRVVVAEPGVVPANELPLGAEQAMFSRSRLALLSEYRLRRLLDRLGGAEVDLVHLIDASMRRAAESFAGSTGTALVCSCFSRRQVEQLHPSPIDTSYTVTCASQGLVELAQRRLPEHVEIELVRPGVFAPSEVTPVLRQPSEALCCAVICNGQADSHLQSLLEGLGRVKPSMPQLQVFICALQDDHRRLWQAARQRDLLDRVNLVGTSPQAKRLLMRCDLLIQPQPLGRVHSLVLEAMASGRPVVATADRLVDYLIDGQTARLLDRPTGQDWADCLQGAVDDPGPLRVLGETAREYVQANHGVSRFVSRMLEVYRRVTAEPIPFE